MNLRTHPHRGLAMNLRSRPRALGPKPAALVGQSEPGPAQSHESLVERYAAMAHEFQHRPVDPVLRLLDIVLAGLVVLLTWPLWVLIAIASKVTSPAYPILYRGWRVGQGGHLFQMMKFRTLAPDAEQRLGPYLGTELTQRTEQEATPLGRVLRASKLDELPQLINVLRGDMSLVGPRPIRPPFFGQLCSEIPEYWQRLVVRPGVTGLAQLRLTREMTWGEKLAHDLEYIADRSLRLYLSVIATTVWLIVVRPANRRSVINRLP